MICKMLSFIFFGLAWFVYKPPKETTESQANLTDSSENKVGVLNGHTVENGSNTTSL